MSISDGPSQNQMGTRNMRLTLDRVMNWLTAPSIRRAPRTYINEVTNTSGMTARINPRSMLPMPTMGNGGRAGNRSRPLLSYSSVFVGLLRALM